MQVVIKGSFYRDWKNIRNKKFSAILLNKIDQVETAKNILQIPHLKKLRNYSSRYKIEIALGKKIYWVLCIVWQDRIEFVRLKTEVYFKKNL